MVFFMENPCGGGTAWCADGMIEKEIASRTELDLDNDNIVVKNDKDFSTNEKSEQKTTRVTKSLLDDTMDETVATVPLVKASSGLTARSKKSLRSTKTLEERIEMTLSNARIAMQKSHDKYNDANDESREEVEGTIEQQKHTHDEEPQEMNLEREPENAQPTNKEEGKEDVPVEEASVSFSPDEEQIEGPSSGEETHEEQQSKEVPTGEAPAPAFTKSVSFENSVNTAESRLSDLITLQSSASSGFSPMKELMAYRKKVQIGLASPRSDAGSSAGADNDYE